MAKSLIIAMFICSATFSCQQEDEIDPFVGLSDELVIKLKSLSNIESLDQLAEEEQTKALEVLRQSLDLIFSRQFVNLMDEDRPEKNDPAKDKSLKARKLISEAQLVNLSEERFRAKLERIGFLEVVTHLLYLDQLIKINLDLKKRAAEEKWADGERDRQCRSTLKNRLQMSDQGLARIEDTALMIIGQLVPGLSL